MNQKHNCQANPNTVNQTVMLVVHIINSDAKIYTGNVPEELLPLVTQLHNKEGLDMLGKFMTASDLFYFLIGKMENVQPGSIDETYRELFGLFQQSEHLSPFFGLIVLFA